MRRGEGMSIAQALAMTVAEIPVFLYSTFGQVNPFIQMHTQSVLCLVISSLLLLLSVHIFPAEAYTEPEEGAVCHSTGQCSSSSHCSSFKKARKKEEAGNTRKGWPEDSGNTRVTHEDRTALIIKERCEDRILCFFFGGGGCCLVSFSSGCCETFNEEMFFLWDSPIYWSTDDESQHSKQ